ncbi:MAG TPA: hypothetical protein VK541_14580 [Pedobacter sp.]|nr:hypothetical protein [Pedobacter sp.]
MNLKIKFSIFLILSIMTVQAQTDDSEARLKQITNEAAIVKFKQEMAANELAIAKAKKDLEALSIVDPKTAAEAKKALADLEKSTIELEKASITAKRDLFKGPEITPLTGKISTNDGVFIETRVLATQTLNQVMRAMVDKMKASKFPSVTPTFVLYNETDIKGVEAYMSLFIQLSDLTSQLGKANRTIQQVLDQPYDFTTTPANNLFDPLLAGFAASGILRSAADVVSLFRITTDFKNAEVAINENTIAAALQNALSANNWKLYNPALIPVNIINNPGSESLFLNKLNEMFKQAEASSNLIKKANEQIESLNTALEKPENKKYKANIEALLKIRNGFVTTLTPLTTAATQLNNLLYTLDATTKVAPIGNIIRADRLSTKLREATTYTMKLVVASKGSNKVSESLWRSARIRFTAGTELSVCIYSSEGELIYGNTHTSFSPYTKTEDIPKSN